jgi:L-lactate dehydrogenase
MNHSMHVSIVGAGSVGVAVASSILHGRMVSRLSLHDSNRDKARGEAMDLAHGAALFGSVDITGDSCIDMGRADVCIITAGAKQRPGESRLALCERNRVALDDIASTLEKSGLPKVVIVVTNPVDLMTEVMRRRLSPRGIAVIGSGTLLDTLRLRYVLSGMLGIAAESIHVSVVGEHGDSSVCLLDSGRAGGVSVERALNRKGFALDEATRQQISSEVRGAASEIIARKGATCHAIGIAVARITRAIVDDERVVLPVSAPIEADLCAGVPCIIGADGATPLPWPTLSPRERTELDRSLLLLRAGCAALRKS